MPAGYRGILEIMYGWPAMAPGAAPSPLPPGRPEVRAHVFDGWSGEYIEDWYDLSALELVYEMTCPHQARATAPAAMPFWDRRRCMPGGRGVYVQFDARDWGLPVWTGRLVNPQPSSGSPDLSAQLAGPQSWLDSYHVPAANPTNEAASQIIYHSLAGARVNPPVRMALEGAYLGPGGKEDLAGRSVWDLATSLKDTRGEWPYLAAVPGTVEYRLYWLHQLSAADLAGEVILRDGENSRWEAVPEIDKKIEELLLISQTWGIGNRVVGTKVRASPVRAFGRKAALTAVVNSAFLQNATGGTQMVVDATIPTFQSGRIAAEAQLRRLVNSVIPARIEVLDTSLWPWLRPGVLLSGRWNDPHRLFRRAVVQVETMTVSPLTGKCDLSAFLWDEED